jgi:hypothetical protein
MKTCSVRQIGKTADLDDAQRRPQGKGQGWLESILSGAPFCQLVTAAVRFIPYLKSRSVHTRGE